MERYRNKNLDKYANIQKHYISICFGTGILICRMEDPDSLGLKGAWEPYGLGIPMSSGI